MTKLPAIHFEGIKYAYRQSKDGIVVSFAVHPQDVPAELSTSSIGARYMVALVEIDDDEQPKAGKPKKERKAAEPKVAEPEYVAKGKQNWRDMFPSAQAAIRCNEPMFWAYLHEHHGEIVVSKPANAEAAAVAIREMCGVASRSELNTKQAGRAIWHQLDEGFQAWKALEHA